MSRPMNFREFADMVNFVTTHNAPIVHGRRYTDAVGKPTRIPVVKYVDPVFDMRTNTVFKIGFRGFGSEKVFHCQNECRELPESLYDRCMAYLEGTL